MSSSTVFCAARQQNHKGLSEETKEKLRCPLDGSFHISVSSPKSCCIRTRMHPVLLRCSSFKYSRYSLSSRLAGRAPPRPRCSHDFGDETLASRHSCLAASHVSRGSA